MMLNQFVVCFQTTLTSHVRINCSTPCTRGSPGSHSPSTQYISAGSVPSLCYKVMNIMKKSCARCQFSYVVEKATQKKKTRNAILYRNPHHLPVRDASNPFLCVTLECVQIYILYMEKDHVYCVSVSNMNVMFHH